MWLPGRGGHTTIQDFALGHENEMFEELGDVGVGLVYCERDRAALRSDVLEGSDDGNRNLRVQPAGGLIQEQTRRRRHQLHPNGCPLLLAARNARNSRHPGPDVRFGCTGQTLHQQPPEVVKLLLCSTWRLSLVRGRYSRHLPETVAPLVAEHSKRSLF